MPSHRRKYVPRACGTTVVVALFAVACGSSAPATSTGGPDDDASGGADAAAADGRGSEASLPDVSVAEASARDAAGIDAATTDAGGSDASNGANDASHDASHDASNGANDASNGANDAGNGAKDAGDASPGTPDASREAGGTAPDAGANDGSVAGPVHAFPEALGFGQVATGGRGGTVVHVTNLNDSGTGSFRDAVSASHRIVVFDVGGYVTLSTAVSVSSDVTIAGQTAPGDGIGIMGREVSFSGSSNDIVRYMRFRQGTLDPDSTKSGINLLDTTTMIFDHVSIQFAQWNNIDAVGASNVTVQYSISADPIGQQFAAHTETGPYTWVGDLFANAHNRCPLAKANTQYVGNVVYNFQAGYTAGNSAGVFSHDIIGNYFISGPSTTNPSDAFYQVNGQLIFNHGNMIDDNADGTLNGSGNGNPGGATALAAAWSPGTASLPIGVTAAAAYAAVIAGAGASLHRDQVDALVISDVTSLGKTGRLWTTQVDTGLANSGYGTLAGGTAPVDTDGDGMPDAWETRYGLNPSSAADANGDFDHTGYTNIEKYINGLADGSYPTN
jgi:hypothetical protein